MQQKTVMPAFSHEFQCSYEWPLGLPSRLNPLGTRNTATKTYLEKDLVTTTINNRKQNFILLLLVLHPDFFWAYHFLDAKDWIVQ